jgi:hypothetical protein
MAMKGYHPAKQLLLGCLLPEFVDEMLVTQMNAIEDPNGERCFPLWNHPRQLFFNQHVFPQSL